MESTLKRKESDSDFSVSGDEDTRKRTKMTTPEVPVQYDVVSDQEDDDNLFRFQAAVLEKNFKGQKSSEKRGTLRIGGNCVGDILRSVWDHCVQFIFKSAVFKETGRNAYEAAWDGKEPEYGDIDRFISFHDENGKRNITPSCVTQKMIHKWLEKTITVTVYRYSDSVSNAHKFHAMEAQLLTPAQKDRAGAEAIESLDTLKKMLFDYHGHRLVADEINWSCWATYISTQPMTQRDDLIKQLPPRHLINLFTTAPVHSDTILTKTRLDLRIASNENRAYRNIVKQLKQDNANLLELVKVMGERIETFEDQLMAHDEMLTAMNGTLTVQENEYSEILAEQVIDCIDIDHN